MREAERAKPIVVVLALEATRGKAPLVAGQYKRPCLRSEAEKVLLSRKGGTEIVRRFVDRGPLGEVAKVQGYVGKVTTGFAQYPTVFSLLLERQTPL